SSYADRGRALSRFSARSRRRDGARRCAGAAVTTLWSSSIDTSRDVVAVRQQAKRIAALLGLALRDQTRLATAVSEVAREVVSKEYQARIEFRLDENPKTTLLIARVHGICASPRERTDSGTQRLLTPGSEGLVNARRLDRKSTRLNSSHVNIS